MTSVRASIAVVFYSSISSLIPYSVVIIRPGKTGSVFIGTPSTTTSLDIDNDTLIVGNLDGQIQNYSLSTGRMLSNVTLTAGAPVGRSLMTQMRSKVNITFSMYEFLFAGMDIGDLMIWRKDLPDQETPISKVSVRGRPLAVIPLEKTIYILTTRKDKKLEELVSIPVSLRRIRAMNERHQAFRGGSSSASVSSAIEAEETVKSGALNIKLANDKTKGKNRFCTLRANGVRWSSPPLSLF